MFCIIKMTFPKRNILYVKEEQHLCFQGCYHKWVWFCWVGKSSLSHRSKFPVREHSSHPFYICVCCFSVFWRRISLQVFRCCWAFVQTSCVIKERTEITLKKKYFPFAWATFFLPEAGCGGSQEAAAGAAALSPSFPGLPQGSATCLSHGRAGGLL